MTRYYGVFASHHRLRERVIPKPAAPPQLALDFALPDDSPASSPRPRRIAWAKLLARVFAIDITCCRKCGGRMRVPATSTRSSTDVGIRSTALTPINYAYSHGLTHEEFLEELRRFEYRSTLEAYEPIDAAGLALSFFDGSVHAPFAEEVPYRALLVPLVRPWIGRFGTALCSGVVFFLLHWLVYGLGPEPSHFFSGAIFAYLFMYAGLGASLAAHAGGNAGIWLLAVYAAFAAE